MLSELESSCRSSGMFEEPLSCKLIYLSVRGGKRDVKEATDKHGHAAAYKSEHRHIKGPG